MAQSYHVFGAAQLLVGTGSVGALESLGYSVDGVEILLNPKFDDIYVDTYGPHVPGDVQYFLVDANIKCELEYYDLAVLNKLLCFVPGVNASVTTGQMWKAGDLMLQNGLTTRLVIRSTPQGTGLTSVETCWNFLNTYLVDSDDLMVGVKRTTHKLTFRAIPSFNAASSVGQTLYNTTCT